MHAKLNILPRHSRSFIGVVADADQWQEEAEMECREWV
jgi:hypothetical protein